MPGMSDYELVPGIDFFTANLYEEDQPVCVGAIPVPEGLAVNAFLIRGEQLALFDVPADREAWNQFSDQFEEAGLDPARLGWLVLPQVSSDLKAVVALALQAAPQARLVCPVGQVEQAQALWPGRQVNGKTTGDRLDLGQGRGLEFWLVTGEAGQSALVARENAAKVLFTGSALSGFGALDEAETDAEAKPAERSWLMQEVGRFWVSTKSTSQDVLSGLLDLLETVAPEYRILAPRHGLVWNKQPGLLLNHLTQGCKAAAGQARLKATLVSGVLPEADQAAWQAVLDGLRAANLDVALFEKPVDSDWQILPELAFNQGLVAVADAALEPLLQLALERKIRSREVLLLGRADALWNRTKTELDWHLTELDPAQTGAAKAAGQAFAEALKQGDSERAEAGPWVESPADRES